jgi:hypothetical protein
LNKPGTRAILRVASTQKSESFGARMPPFFDIVDLTLSLLRSPCGACSVERPLDAGGPSLPLDMGVERITTENTEATEITRPAQLRVQFPSLRPL